jgi:hypothetical protein
MNSLDIFIMICHIKRSNFTFFFFICMRSRVSIGRRCPHPTVPVYVHSWADHTQNLQTNKITQHSTILAYASFLADFIFLKPRPCCVVHYMCNLQLCFLYLTLTTQSSFAKIILVPDFIQNSLQWFSVLYKIMTFS